MTTTIYNRTNMKNRRRELRKKQTPQEKRLWKFVRGRNLREIKFRRQYSVGGFVLDFYCPEVKLALEIDGPIHRYKKKHDRFRQISVEGMKIRFLRFTNDEIDNEFDKVVERIALEIGSLRSNC